MDWTGIKGLAEEVALSKDALHIYGAFIIHVLAALLLRRPLSSWLPWASVLAAELLNEFLDVRFGDEVSLQDWQVAGAKHDIINTMLIPTALMLLCRYRNRLFQLEEVAHNSGKSKEPTAE